VHWLTALVAAPVGEDRVAIHVASQGTSGGIVGLNYRAARGAHLLRARRRGRGMTYIEVIPILLYASIVFVVMNAILLASPLKVRFIEYRHNLLPVLAYWPVMLGLLLASTLVVFFRP
jgi:hypothetical protein